MKPSAVSRQFEQYESKREALQMEINKQETKAFVDRTVFAKTKEERELVSKMKSDYKQYLKSINHGR